MTTLPRTLAALLSLLVIAAPALADDLAPIHIKYASGKTQLVTLHQDAKFFSNRNYTITTLPDELLGLSCTHRDGGRGADFTADIPANSTLYILISSDKGRDANAKGIPELNKKLADSGWTRLPDAEYVDKNGTAIAVYRQTFTAAATLNIATAGWPGIVAAAKSLSLEDAKPLITVTPSPSPAAANAGPLASISRRQTSIKTLCVHELENDILLGQTMDFILTATPGPASDHTSVSFTTSVGGDMHTVLEETLRTVRLRYPKWAASKIELSFGDKYSPKDGGSIGAAAATLLLSSFQGFAIDPKLAMTGDLTVDSKIRPVGGIVAKIHGATDSNCTVVALPDDNFQQLSDGLVYEGPAILTGVQILGMSTIDDAVAITRSDRDAKLAEALNDFADIQQLVKQHPEALHAKDTQEKLSHILDLAPNHLSAKLLLAVSQNKQPTRLSLTASIYYTTVAVKSILPILDHSNFDRHHFDSAAIQSGLRALNKTRLIADPQSLPLINAYQDWIETARTAEQDRRATELLASKRDAILDAQTKLHADRDSMEKMLHEGI